MKLMRRNDEVSERRMCAGSERARSASHCCAASSMQQAVRLAAATAPERATST